MRCVIYRRVSTDMQAEEGFSLDAQRMRLEAYAASQGWNIVDDYCDEGFSAKNTDRPQMQRLIADIKNNKFDVVLVYRLDRFVRSVLDLHELLQLMDKHDVKFKSATEVFDTTSATGRLFITMIATLAQWERETIAERVHMGMTKKAEQGLRNGAPAPYGYDLIDGKLIVNQEEAKWVRYMFSRYPSVGSQSIAKELNKKGIKTKKGEVWSDFSVRYILKNPIYTGTLRWNYESISKGTRKRTGEEITQTLNQDDFEAIVDNEKFQEIQKIMKKRKTDAFRSDNHYPFSGVMKCQNCGYNFSGASKKLRSGKVHRYYKCRGRINFGVCDVQAISEETIEEVFLNLLDMEAIEMNVAHVEPLMSEEDIKKQINHLTKKRERAEELYIEGDIKKERYQRMLNDIKAEELELLSISQKRISAASIQLTKEMLRNIKKEWLNFSYEARKIAIHSLFKSITIKVVEEAVPPHKKAVLEITRTEL
ncbi:resolvase [Brevibacillus brevis]|uniref:recombinase family protein n=1 Tax=Brevibacillus brevis TaxID=1393 RepID=UPI0019000B16|nr:recombinase family protein [Brevibacillus brevis]MBH0331440.1 resolvase [Brevibacillus brevis]